MHVGDLFDPKYLLEPLLLAGRKHLLGPFKGFFMEIKKVEISMKNPIQPQQPVPVEAPPPSGK